MPVIGPPKSRARLWLATAALVLYGSVVLVVVFSPTPIDRGSRGAIEKLLSLLHRNGIPDWFGYNKLEFSANIVMFIPLGFLIALVLQGRAWWAVLLIGPGLSVAIELIQGALLSQRFSTVSDVIANSLGAIIGLLAALGVRRLVHDRDEKLLARALWARG